MKKHILFILFLILPTTCYVQTVLIKNVSNNDYEIKVIKEGVLIHHHIMHNKDELTVKDVGWYGTRFQIKQLTFKCQETSKYKEIPLIELSDGWRELYIDRKMLINSGKPNRTLGILPSICSNKKGA